MRTPMSAVDKGPTCGTYVFRWVSLGLFLLLAAGIGVLSDRGSARLDARAMNIAACAIYVLASLVPIAVLSMTEQAIARLGANVTRKRAIMVITTSVLILLFCTFPVSAYTFEFGSNASLMQAMIMPVLLSVTTATWFFALVARRVSRGGSSSESAEPTRGRPSHLLLDFVFNFLAAVAALTYLASFNPYKLSEFGGIGSATIPLIATVALFIQFKFLFQYGPRVVIALARPTRMQFRSNMILLSVSLALFLAFTHAYVNTAVIDDPVAYSQFIGFLAVFSLSVFFGALGTPDLLCGAQATRSLLTVGALLPLAYLPLVGIFDHIFHGMYHTMYYEFERRWLLFPRIAGAVCFLTCVVSIVQMVRVSRACRLLERGADK